MVGQGVIDLDCINLEINNIEAEKILPILPFLLVARKTSRTSSAKLRGLIQDVFTHQPASIQQLEAEFQDIDPHSEQVFLKAFHFSRLGLIISQVHQLTQDLLGHQIIDLKINQLRCQEGSEMCTSQFFQWSQESYIFIIIQEMKQMIANLILPTMPLKKNNIMVQLVWLRLK